MEWKAAELRVRAPRRGLHDITAAVKETLAAFGMREGMLYLFLRHTSASLCLNENWDPTAKRDLEAFLERLAPDGADWHEHTLEGDDDSSSHMKALVTGAQLSIPVAEGAMMLGTWQGIYLCEHRLHPEARTVIVRALMAG